MSRIEEIPVYDSLGPLTREAIRESPIDIDIRMLIPAFKRDVLNSWRGGSMDAYEALIGRFQTDLSTVHDSAFADFINRRIRAKAPGYTPLRRRTRANGRGR